MPGSRSDNVSLRDAAAKTGSIIARAQVVRRVGRRPGDSGTAETILDVAEQEFAARGYDGTSLREITEKADVNQALVRYYYGSKEGLYRAAYLRRGKELSSERIRLLDALEATGRTPQLEDIVIAFLKPAMDIKRQGPGGLAYMRLQARVQNETRELERNLRNEVYGESTRRYVEALQRAVPKVDPAAMYWRMVFMVGAYFYAISGANRIETISDGKYRSTDIDEAFRQLVSFLVAGLRAPVSESKHDDAAPPPEAPSGRRRGRSPSPVRRGAELQQKGWRNGPRS
jgi:AcrR family transcriptional regulator